MANLNLIRTIASEKKIQLKEISEKVGLTPGGLQNIMSQNSTKIETLEKIADVLGVPVTVFFTNENENIVLKEENQKLKEKNVLLHEELENLNEKLKLSELKYKKLNSELDELFKEYDSVTNYKKTITEMAYVVISKSYPKMPEVKKTWLTFELAGKYFTIDTIERIKEMPESYLPIYRELLNDKELNSLKLLIKEVLASKK